MVLLNLPSPAYNDPYVQSGIFNMECYKTVYVTPIKILKDKLFHINLRPAFINSSSTEDK